MVNSLLTANYTQGLALTVDDVVLQIKVEGKNPRRTIVELARKGILRGRKIGKSWRFHPQAVSDFLLGKS